MTFNHRKNSFESEMQSEEIKQMSEALQKFSKPIIYHREEIIKQVEKCILNDRQNTYGTPEDNFQTIANLWNEYLGIRDEVFKLSPQDVAIMMMLLKVARMKSSPNHLDNYIDAAGYSIIAGSFCKEEEND